jgi:pimeloyl-ACP methyl ester carboxylesterase
MLPAKNTELVVLVHGLWMPAWVMLPLAWRLEAMGFRCVRFGYRSMRAPLEENADRLAAFVRGLDAQTLHLVGHSLGGVLALHTTVSRRLARVRSIVMAGSPARDSHAARRLAERAWGRRLLGRTVPQWLASATPAAPAGVAVGVIAGTAAFGLGLIVAPDLERPHDGVVCVAETAVSGASDHVEVPVSHAAMLTSARVAGLIGRFLRSGRFDAAAGSEPSGRSEPRLLDRERGRP